MKHRACLIMAAFDRGRGLTALDVQRICERLDVRTRFGPHPLGVSPWRRITDCVEEGWVVVGLDVHGQPETRHETYGKEQQVYHVTDLGRSTALLVRRTLS
jgi:hypothetical protein